MLHRSKSNRSQTRRRSTNLSVKPTAAAAERLKAQEARCSDDDSSQSSSAAAPVFASVHRTRHAGISAIKRDGIPTATTNTTSTIIMNLHGNQQHQHHQPHQQQQQRPSYQQYQQQRRQQQQQQQHHHQLESGNRATTHKFGKCESSNWYEKQYQQQQQQQNLPLQIQQQQLPQLQSQQQEQYLSSLSTIIKGVETTLSSTALSSPANAPTATATATAVGYAKQSIAVPIPQLPIRQMNQGLEFQSTANIQQQQQQQQHQQQQSLVPTTITTTAAAQTSSRIPMMMMVQQQQQNFNQISKTTPNFLNDIYEKHLLSQTTFQENELQQQQQHHRHPYQLSAQQQQQQHLPHHFQQQFLMSNRLPPGINMLQSGADDFNLNNFPENIACIQRQQQQQQRHHLSRPLKPVHFLKMPPPPPPTRVQAPVSTSTPTSTKHFHYMQQQQQLHSVFTARPPSPGSLNHVYETIAERPPMAEPPPPLPPPPPFRQPNVADGTAPVPPPLPPGRQTRKRLVAAVAAQGAAGPSGRLTKSSHKKTLNMTADNHNNNNNNNHSNSSNNHRKHGAENIGKSDNYCVAANDNQSQLQLPLPTATTTPPAYVTPPPAGGEGGKGGRGAIATIAIANVQEQQQQLSHKRLQQQPSHHYNMQQRTKADGEHKSYVYQQLREHQQQKQQQHQQQQQHFLKASSIMKREQQQHQKQNQSAVREVPLGANAAAAAVPITATTTTTTSKTKDADAALVISVEEQLRLAGLLHNSNNGNNGNNNSDVSNPNNSNINNNTNNFRSGLCSALPIVFEEEAIQGGDFKDLPAADGAGGAPACGAVGAPAVVVGDAAVGFDDDEAAVVAIGVGVGALGTAKLPYRRGKIEVSLETAQAMAAAAYYARAAQKFAQSGSTKTTRTTDLANPTPRNGGFCGALQRAPPPMPPGLARRLANKENYGIGKVKVMLRVADTHSEPDSSPHFMTVDKKKRQVTLTDPAAASTVAASSSQERGPMVAAPKMFAFDSLFTADDQQSDVCSSALSEVIPAVLEGSDGCLMTIGYPSSGQSKTMLGSVNPPGDLGAIPCAISWLYKGINERRQKSGARFSVRVSALGVSATKPDSSSKDLLAAHATESDDSPGVYLRDDFLGGPTELRAPTAERAALFLDAALAGRPQGGLEPAMIFTLHVYQYSLSRKGGVAGGRSRLHLIDLGGCANRNGGLPLSGIGNVLLAILSGQRHPPNKDHPLTPLLKDCLAPLTCHVAIMAHVMHTQSHTDALTTIQLASRIHRMRRRKHRFPMQADKSGAGLAAALNGGHQSTGSSAGSGADPSSSELSADTVIYMGPSDEATDGEHPPVYLPSLSSGDNRGVMSKALKGSGIEKQQPSPSKIPGSAKKVAAQKAPQSPLATSRTSSLKRGHANSPTPLQPQQTSHVADQPKPQFFSPSHSLKTIPHSASSPKIVAGSLRHPNIACTMSPKGSNVASPKGSPMRRPGVGIAGAEQQLNAVASDCPGSPMRKITEEQWIDGPRVSRAKVAEARHLLREVNHVKQCETWIDGPKSQSSRSLTAGNLPTTAAQTQGYGFMDSHKKIMIRQWVENQTSQVFQSSSAACSPTHQSRVEQQAQHIRDITYQMAPLKQKSLDANDFYVPASQTLQSHQLLADQQSLRSSQQELVNPIFAGLTTALSTTNVSAPAEVRGSNYNRQNQELQQHLQQQLQQQLTQQLQLQLQQQLQNPTIMSSTQRDETDLHSERSLHSHHGGYGMISQSVPASEAGHQSERGLADCDEDQDSGPSEVPPALPLIEPLGSREISHESLHRILSRHVSRESLYQQQQQQHQQHQHHQQHHQHQQQELRRQENPFQQQQRTPSHHYSQHSIGMSDCGLQVTEEEIARTMGSEHPLSALSNCDNMSIVSSFNMAGDAFSDCAMGERTRNQFDQLARLREIFTSQLAMAEVTPVFRTGCDVGSVYSEPAYRFNTGPGSVCSEPPYRAPSPRLPSHSPSQGSLPSLTGIMQIAGMEQYASLRHPDGASDPNLPKLEKPFVLEQEDINEVDEKSALLSPSKRPALEAHEVHDGSALKHHKTAAVPLSTQTQLPLLPLNTSSEAYDSGHDSSTPRTSKHSGISRRAESGYHSVATARDSDESSFTSGISKEHNRITVVQKKRRQEKGLCTWLMNPFTCTYPETEGEISDF